jgi:hypothetical protein
VQKLGRSNNCHWIQPERSGPLRRFHVQEAVQQRSAQEKGYGPSDLGPITHQPLDLTGAARGLNFVNRRVKVPKGIGASGYRHSGYRKSRRQEIGNLQGENPETHQSHPSIWDTWQRLTSLRHIGGQECEGTVARRILASGEPETRNPERGFQAAVISEFRESTLRGSRGQEVERLGCKTPK